MGRSTLPLADLSLSLSLNRPSDPSSTSTSRHTLHTSHPATSCERWPSGNKQVRFLKYEAVCRVDSLLSRPPLKTHHASLNCSKLAFSHEPRNIQPIEPHTNPLFSHTLCVFPQNIHKNALLRRGISQGHQGASGGIKGHQLSVSQGFRGIS